jgi:UDP-N-acetylmuramyl pentapeptide synthase
LEVALQALSVAKASRKIAIVGDVIDSQMSHRRRKRYVARIVAEAADVGLFVGKDFGRLAQGEAAKFGMPPERSRALLGWTDLADWLRSESRPGDVILLNCWMKHHLERAVIAQFGEIGCYLPDCQIVARCEDCEKLGLVQIQAS